MKIAILGFAQEGQAAYDYWNRANNEVTICDQNTALEVPEGTQTQLGVDYLKNLDRFDILVRTPALYPGDIAAANPDSPHILDKVTSITNEFFRVSPTKNIIGVTGTKGKGTTSTLIAKMLEAAGKRVHLGGNIGIPLFELLKNNIQADDWVVMELSSFQLIDLKHSPRIAACLMVVPEHLDWHEHLDEYITAKQQLFRWQTPDDIAIYYADSENSKTVVAVSPGRMVPYYAAPGAVIQDDAVVIDGKNIVSLSEIKLLGAHNFQNICAAVTVFWQISQDVSAVRWVVNTFAGLEHRLELVREVNGVRYYDDSFGTTPETAIVAIEAFEEPKVVILGGSDKGANYDKLAMTVKNHNVRTVVVIGKTGATIAEALKAHGLEDIVEGGEVMQDIVRTASSHAKPGDIVLLSPGCASFGLFNDYKDRGEQFKRAVGALGSP